ncbi:MAG: hypothetical protein CMO29_19630 [Tistrella sp.]|nr:hypothetical protein [Tistrella sp.]
MISRVDDVADTPEVLWTRRAREDVRDIYRWTFTHFGRRQADLWAEALTRATDIIRRQPDIGARAPFPPGYRRFPLRSHVIYYRASSGRFADRPHPPRVTRRRTAPWWPAIRGSLNAKSPRRQRGLSGRRGRGPLGAAPAF